MLLSTYFLVLLHSIVPHFHGESDCISNKEVNHHASHHHHEGDHHEHNSTDGILHTLGHLFNGFHHLDIDEEHLTHVNTKINKFEFSNLSFAINIRNSFLPTLYLIKEHKRKNFSVYSAPPLEHVLNSALPLRAPPVKG